MPGAKNAIGKIVESSIYKFKAGFSLCLSIKTGRTSIFTISEDDIAGDLCLDDGSVHTLRASGDYNPHRSSLDNGCYVFVFYDPDDKAFAKLRSQNVEKIYVFTSLGKMIFDIKDKNQLLFANSC